MELTVKKLKDLYMKKGAPWDVFNLFGIRFEENQKKDVFNDYIGFATDLAINWFPGTTDPGREATEKKEGGAAHLCLGYHKNLWEIGMHPRTLTEQNKAFRHKAFVQASPCLIWRDKDRDGVKDAGDPVVRGIFGINLHRASIKGSALIGPYSYGCQVCQLPGSLDILLHNAEKSGLKLFSYMLLDKSEVK